MKVGAKNQGTVRSQCAKFHNIRLSGPRGCSKPKQQKEEEEDE